MKRKYFLVYAVICILLKINAMASEYSEILNYLKNNNQWSSSISLQATTKYSSTVNDNITITNITFIRDNQRCQWKGASILKTKEGEIIKEGSNATYTIMNGEQYLEAIGPDLDKFWKGVIKKTDYNAIQNLMLNEPALGSAFWGRIYGNNNFNIYELIEQSQNIKYGKSDFFIDGLECYEIEGTCKYGNIKIIFSPERGYFPLKWEINKKPGDYFDNKLLSGKYWKVTFAVDEFKNIDRFHIPMKAHLQHDVVYKDGKTTSLFYDYDLSNVQISPDFEAINAFKFDLPSDVPVYLEIAPGIKFHFDNGKLTTLIDQDFLDVLDDEIKQIKTENEKPQSQLPTINQDIKIEPNNPVVNKEEKLEPVKSIYKSTPKALFIFIAVVFCLIAFSILIFLKLKAGNK